jgi:hypothetical protein
MAMALPSLAQTDPLEFVTESLPEAVKGEQYLTGDTVPLPVRLEATGGVYPYTFELSDGVLPDGLILEFSGIISGVPTSCSISVFQSRVRDSAGESAVRTFLLQAGGPPELILDTLLSPVVEAGMVATIELELRNDGCETVDFDSQTRDFGPVLPNTETFAARSTDEDPGELAALMEMGAPVPRSIGRRMESATVSSGGWYLDAEGRLLDAEGNPAGMAPVPVAEGLAFPTQGGVSILYVNESGTQGEMERFEGLGYTVVQALVPQALDLDTLRAFDILWLTAASDSVFPSRDAVNQYVWEGGGVVVEQVQFSGFTGFLPAGYTISALTPNPGGDINVLQFTEAAADDPLTSGLATSDLASNFDTAFPDESGARWSWLAVQADQPILGTLATAAMGAGRLVYHTGNLGTSLTPLAEPGSDAYVSRLVESAASGTTDVSCPWLAPGEGISNVRIEDKTVDDVEPFDVAGEIVQMQIDIDTTQLLPGQYTCELRLLTDDSENLEHEIDLVLTVSDPVPPTILPMSLPHAQPGSPYAATVLAAGGTEPYTFSLVAGSLPAGLALEPTSGVISGNPGESGNFEPVFRLTDDTGAFDEATLPLASGFVITTESMPDATIGQVYVVPVFATGGVPPYRFEMDETVDYQLPFSDPNLPEADVCFTTDLGGGRLETICALPEGTYRVSFDPVDGTFTPAPVDVYVPVDGAAVVDGEYLLPGSITVNTNLAEAIYAVTAETEVGKVDLLGAGESTTFSDLPPGDYTVTFGTVQGYATPAEQTDILVEGGTLTFQGDYIDIRVDPPPDTTQIFPATQAPPVTEDDVGFGYGTLTVTTDAPGAAFRLLSNRPLTSLVFLEPSSQPGSGAAVFGRMSTFDPPVLVSGQQVSFAIIAEDSAGNRARKTYAPTVWNQPVLSAVVVAGSNVTPAPTALGLESNIWVLGTGLRESVDLSFGSGVDVEVGKLGNDIFGPFLGARINVAQDAEAATRDLIYTDPILADTAVGSIIRLDQALSIFVDVGTLDIDDSERVDGFDLAAVSSAFGLSQGDPSFDPAKDVNNDGSIDGSDLQDLAIAFGRDTLRFDPATLPPPHATLGVEYRHEIGFIGGTLFVDARQLTGPLQDGLALSIFTGDDPPASTRLIIEGIPAEAGTVTVRVQAVDAFFAIDTIDLEVTVDP